MAQTVRGIYQDGKVELMEWPHGVTTPTEVIVTFPNAPATRRQRTVHRQRCHSRP